MAIDTRTGKGENAAPLRHRFPFFDNKYYEPGGQLQKSDTSSCFLYIVSGRLRNNDEPKRIKGENRRVVK